MTNNITITELKPGHKLAIDNYTGRPLTVTHVTREDDNTYTIEFTSQPGNDDPTTFTHVTHGVPADYVVPLA